MRNFRIFPKAEVKLNNPEKVGNVPRSEKLKNKYTEVSFFLVLLFYVILYTKRCMQLSMEENQNQITDIVWHIVSSMQNLPATQSTNANCNMNSSLGNQDRSISVEQEINQKFQIPRGSEVSLRRPPPRNRGGRFVPY